MRLYSVEGGTLRLNLHAGQSRAWDSAARFVFVLAGSQSGKTSFGPWWLWREIEQCGAGDYLAVTATYDQFKLKMLPELRTVFEHVLGIGRYWAGDGIIEIRDPQTGRFWAERSSDPMWARVILRSAESKGGLESTSALAAWLDECGQNSFTLETWEAVRRRLALSRGRVLGTTTPYNLGWLKINIVDQAAHDSSIDVINFPSTQNPAFSVEEFEERRRSMPAHRFAMFYEGRFARPAGQIYGDYVDALREDGGHLVRDFELPREWPRYVGVDPGAVNCAMVWLAHDVSENVYYLYRESLEGGKSTREHAQGAARLARERGERVVMYGVGQKSEVQTRLDWQAAGVRNVTEPSIHDVEAGIDRVVELLRQHRLIVFESCRGVRDELGRYVRVLDEQGNATDKISNKEQFHRLDALRYGVIVVTTPRGVFVG